LTNDRIRELENQIKASVMAFFGKFSLKGWIRVGIVGAFSQGLRTLQLVRTGDQPVQQLSGRVVNGLLSSISQMEVDKVGKICTIDDPQVKLSPSQVSFEAIVMECSQWPGRRLAFSGWHQFAYWVERNTGDQAVFDMPEDVAEELLKLPANSEIVIHVLKMVRILTASNFPFVSESCLICPLTRRVWQEGWLERYLLLCGHGSLTRKEGLCSAKVVSSLNLSTYLVLRPLIASFELMGG
jgi:hypothetical protein